MSAHTPGPWEVFEAWGIDDELCFHQINSKATHETVASTWAGPNVANARLIAAAPTMYALLERLAKLSNGLNNSSSGAEYMATQLADEASRFISEMTGVSA